MKDDEYRTLKRMAKAAGIEFTSEKYHPSTASDLAEGYKETFRRVRDLGRTEATKFESPPKSAGDASNCSWKNGTLKKAVQIMHSAQRCRAEKRNESGWRYEIEPRLFERFDREIACKRCRKMMERLETEVDFTCSVSETAPTSLGPRSQICECTKDQTSHTNMNFEALFSSRIEEICMAPLPDETRPLPKKRPDRIHGLRRTISFDTLLQLHDTSSTAPRQASDPEQDIIQSSMQAPNGGCPLMFPFLIVEAKREKRAESFDEMEIQTAFPIMYALQLQQNLWEASKGTPDVSEGPLVWFLANRGEDWRVYAGYTEEREGKMKYLITYLWAGSITGIDETTQLLLIIDHIVEWARDSLRPRILRQLRALSAVRKSNQTTPPLDPDICDIEMVTQMKDQVIDIEDSIATLAEEISSKLLGKDDISDRLHQFTTKYGVVKDAVKIHSRLRGLLITRDNLDSLLQSFKNPDSATQFAKSVILTLNRRCVALASENVLNSAEKVWTNCSRKAGNRHDRKIYVQFRISLYINCVWDQVRELLYLAVTDEARELLVDRAGLRHESENSKFLPEECRPRTLILILRLFRRNSVRKDLVSALCRRTYMVAINKSRIMTVDTQGVCHLKEIEPSVRQDRDVKSPGVSMELIVNFVYESCRIGSSATSEPFLRSSGCVDGQERPLWKGWAPGDDLPAGEGHLAMILVHANIPIGVHLPEDLQQTYCLYVLDGQPDLVSPDRLINGLNISSRYNGLYSTIRKPMFSRKNAPTTQNNRTMYWFDFDDPTARSLLTTSLDQFQSDIRKWVVKLEEKEKELSKVECVVS